MLVVLSTVVYVRVVPTYLWENQLCVNILSKFEMRSVSHTRTHRLLVSQYDVVHIRIVHSELYEEIFNM